MIKSSRSLLFLLPVALIALALFSFKSEEHKKEYCVITPSLSNWIVVKPDKSVVKFPGKGDFGLSQTEMLNKLSSEGWVLKSAVTLNNSDVVIYMERIKQ